MCIYIYTGYIHTYRVGSIQKHLGDRLRQARAEAPHGTARGNPLPPEASADTFGSSSPDDFRGAVGRGLF